MLAKITGQSGNELEYAAKLWVDRLAPRTSNSKGPLRCCSDSRVNEEEHRWHARAFIDSGSAPAWDRIRELEAHISRSMDVDPMNSSGPAKATKQGPSLWKRLRWWLLGTVIVGWIASPVITEWAVYWFGPTGKAVVTKNGASLEFENRWPFVAREVYGGDQINVYYFKVRIHNSYGSTIRARYFELTDLRTLEGGDFIPWQDADPVVLTWDARTGKEIPPQARVLVSFARIFPPELQKKTDAILSGDLDIPQLRFTVNGWPRKMTSHIPPGTHRFKLRVYFENLPPAETELELEFPGMQRESVESMAKTIKIKLVE